MRNGDQDREKSYLHMNVIKARFKRRISKTNEKDLLFSLICIRYATFTTGLMTDCYC